MNGKNNFNQEYDSSGFSKSRYSRRILKIISFAAKIIIPLIIPLTWRFFGYAINLIPGLKDGFGITALIGALLIFFPVYCLLYGWSASKSKYRIAFACYNSIATFCAIFFTTNLSFYELYNRYLAIAIMFLAWIALWTFIPVLIHNSIMKKIGKNTNIEESLDSKEDSSQADIENTNDEQEDSEKIRSETFIDDNSYSAQMKWGFKRAIRLFIPFCFPIKWVALIQITGHLFKVLLGVSATSGKLFAMFVFFPISCIAYSWSVAKNEKDKYFFALYNPVVSILSCSIFNFIISIKYILPFFAIFCLLSLVPVWIYNYEYDTETDAESENDTQENDNS